MATDIELQLFGATVDRGSGRDRVRALEDVSLVLRRGESIAIMGASGSGKTTLALALAALVPLAAGRIDGPAMGRIAMALQRPEASFVREVVLDEVVAARTWGGESLTRAAPIGRAALAEMGFTPDVEQRDPLALSGGEQRRVAIAAVLATAPRVVVLDEPSAGLDREARSHLHDAVGRLRAAGRSIVIVTHDPAEGASLADRLVVLLEGRIVHDGPPAAVLADPAAAGSIGLDVAPEVAVLAAAAAARGLELPRTDGTPAGAIDALAELVRGGGGSPLLQASAAHAAPASAPTSSRPQSRPQPLSLPPAGEPRLRLLAFALTLAAAFIAGSVAASAVVLAAVVASVLLVGVRPARLIATLRALALLGALLVVAQLIFRASPEVAIVGDDTVRSGMLAVLRRVLQGLAIVLASLVLTESTGPASLAAGLRTLLAPLRLVRVPVDDAALVSASGLGFVPVLTDELDRLALAQRARGILPRGRGPLATMRLRSMLVVPLIVLAFRRAHLLAEALHVRGYVRGARRTTWRPHRATAADVAAFGAGIALIALAVWL